MLAGFLDVDGYASASSAPAVSSVDDKHGTGGEGSCAGGEGMELGVSRTSPGEGITPGEAGSYLARPQRSPASCLPACPGGKRHVPPWWAGLGQVEGKK